MKSFMKKTTVFNSVEKKLKLSKVQSIKKQDAVLRTRQTSQPNQKQSSYVLKNCCLLEDASQCIKQVLNRSKDKRKRRNLAQNNKNRIVQYRHYLTNEDSEKQVIQQTEYVDNGLSESLRLLIRQIRLIFNPKKLNKEKGPRLWQIRLGVYKNKLIWMEQPLEPFLILKSTATCYKLKQQQKRRGVRNNPGSYRYWTAEENLIYVRFLHQNMDLIEDQSSRKELRIFKAISSLIGSRKSTQVKSHHQKMLRKWGSVETLLDHYLPLLTESSMRLDEEVQPSPKMFGNVEMGLMDDQCRLFFN